jgi:hypothetical protein
VSTGCLSFPLRSGNYLPVKPEGPHNSQMQRPIMGIDGLPRIRPEIFRFRMMEDDGRDGGFGVHHIAFGQFEADPRGDVEKLEELVLVREIGAGGVAEGDTDASIFFSE